MMRSNCTSRCWVACSIAWGELGSSVKHAGIEQPRNRTLLLTPQLEGRLGTYTRCPSDQPQVVQHEPEKTKVVWDSRSA